MGRSRPTPATLVLSEGASHRLMIPLVAFTSLLSAGPMSAPCGQEPPGDIPLVGFGEDGVLSSSTYDCTESTDTGYDDGSPFEITVVHIDGKPVEKDTANAFWVMREAAAADGVEIHVVSGFRTMDEQEYLYMCYQCCCCNSCNLAASPGYSNHQSGHALDLNASSSGVHAWLVAHGGEYGFSATVPSENWHWEWWGGGPGAASVTSPRHRRATSTRPRARHPRLGAGPRRARGRDRRRHLLRRRRGRGRGGGRASTRRHPARRSMRATGLVRPRLRARGAAVAAGRRAASGARLRHRRRRGRQRRARAKWRERAVRATAAARWRGAGARHRQPRSLAPRSLLAVDPHRRHGAGGLRRRTRARQCAVARAHGVGARGVAGRRRLAPPRARPRGRRRVGLRPRRGRDRDRRHPRAVARRHAGAPAADPREHRRSHDAPGRRRPARRRQRRRRGRCRR
ncbi:MAG: D-alanyl-D-alanine carboxypeptidase family protein [Deltaproteobacteria bacterium]|nr:D-alanyl-D-alanine carboxypeptidase family protein [Deltaproteobacteria bacterium]